MIRLQPSKNTYKTLNTMNVKAQQCRFRYGKGQMKHGPERGSRPGWAVLPGRGSSAAFTQPRYAWCQTSQQAPSSKQPDTLPVQSCAAQGVADLLPAFDFSWLRFWTGDRLLPARLMY